jgi:hypothetical protein
MPEFSFNFSITRGVNVDCGHLSFVIWTGWSGSSLLLCFSSGESDLQTIKGTAQIEGTFCILFFPIVPAYHSALTPRPVCSIGEHCYGSFLVQ